MIPTCLAGFPCPSFPSQDNQSKKLALSQSTLLLLSTERPMRIENMSCGNITFMSLLVRQTRRAPWSFVRKRARVQGCSCMIFQTGTQNQSLRPLQCVSHSKQRIVLHRTSRKLLSSNRRMTTALTRSSCAVHAYDPDRVRLLTAFVAGDCPAPEIIIMAVADADAVRATTGKSCIAVKFKRGTVIRRPPTLIKLHHAFDFQR